MLPPKIVVGVRESLMLLVNNHILKMAAMLKPNTEYNRKAAIIEGLRVAPSAMEIIRFFGSRSIVYDVVAKYKYIYGFRTIQRRFQYASEEELFERTHREDPQLKGSSADFR